MTPFYQILNEGLPLWILCGVALACFLVEAFLLKKSKEWVYILALAGLVLAGLYATRWGNLSSIPFSGGAETIIINGNEVAPASPSTSPTLNFFRDGFSAITLIMLLGIGFLSLLNSFSYLKAHKENTTDLPSTYVNLLLFSLVGMGFLIASDNLILAFLGFEIMSLAIYVLVATNKKNNFSSEGAMKYYVLGSVASSFMLFGIVLIYANTQTFSITALSKFQSIPEILVKPQIAYVLLFTGFLFKLASVPFHFWVPDAYQGAPSPVTGFMSAAVKVSVVAFLLRLLGAFSFLPTQTLSTLFAVAAIASLIGGNLGALKQDNVKRMLAYSSIAHAGFLFLALAVGYTGNKLDPQMVSNLLFYLVVYSVMTLGAFSILSIMTKGENEATDFSDFTGLAKNHPWLSLAFMVFMLSLLGLPPFAGFTAKYLVLSYTIQKEYYGLAIVGVLTSLLSAAYYLRILVFIYFKNNDGRDAIHRVSIIPFPLMFVLVFCIAAVLYLGLNPQDYLVWVSKLSLLIP